MCCKIMSINQATQITKDQHIVPQRHLKNFLIPNDTKLECFNVDALRLEKPQSPISICKGYFHYAIEPGREDKYSQMVEKSFGNIEDWYGKNIDRMEKLLISKHRLSDDDKYAVSWIIANFYFRGYRFRQEIQKTMGALVEWMAPNVSEHTYQECLKSYPNAFPDSREAKKLTQEITKELLLAQTKNTSHATNCSFDEGHANTLTHKKWRILINHSTEHPFITGDEAVIEITNDLIPSNFLSRGFLCLTHTFHLSPKIAIVASYPFNEEMHGQVVFEDVTNNKAEIFKSNLLYVNHTYAYGSNRAFFNWLIDFENRKKEKISL